MHTLVRGFTLIELILVVAIIGVLASIVIASFASARTSAKVARTQQELKQLAEAMFWAKSNSELGLPQICVVMGVFVIHAGLRISQR
jgi:prepilin-type N-terminal cleavage/methylation domain-containing protein